MTELVLPPPKRKRSRRLRKKLRIGEFQQLGFEYDLEWRVAPDPQLQDRFLDSLLDQIIAPRSLSLGGGLNGGFIASRRGRVTEDDRTAFECWLKQWPGISRSVVGPLRDAWYDSPN